MARPTPGPPAEIIDAFGDVSRLRDDFAPTEALYQKLYKQLKETYADAAPDGDFVAWGERWILDVSARRMERTVEPKLVQKKLGPRNFLRVCTVTLKALESYLLKPEIDALAVSAQTGSRSFVTTLKPEA